ncbi:MAG: Ig-like domain-containing protein [Lachnospiraceae bacterium]|nr:Ig-like domain-containing protein [Lachnospiraceae bacterium]
MTWYVKSGLADVSINENVITITPTAVGSVSVVITRESTSEALEINLDAVKFAMTYLNTAGGNVAKGDKIKLTSNAPAQFFWTVDGDDGYFEGSSSAGVLSYTFTANRIGNLTITAKDTVSNTTVTKTVVVRKPLEIIGDSKVAKGKSITLSTTKNVVSWSSSNSAVATISQAGKVTGKKAGTTTITATFPEYGNRKVTKTITVTAS